MTLTHWRRVVLGALLAFTGAASAQAAPDDPILMESGPVKLYRSEYEAELLKLPSDVRPGFANSQRRIADLLNRMMVQKILASQAVTQDLARDPVNAVRVRLEHDRVLAQIRVADVEQKAGRDFDARRGQFEARARELYAAERRKYETPEQVSVSHLLFDLRKHPRDEGRTLAAAARARIVAGADFNAVAKEVSEDPSVGMNGGRLGWFGRGEMDAAFTEAAFALRNPGEVSEPVLSAFGWHLVRLEERRPARVRPYEEVHEVLMSDLRKRYVDEQRDNLLNALRDDPSVKANKAAIDALYVPRPTADMLRNAPEAGAADKGADKAAPPPSAPRSLGTPPPGLGRPSATPPR